MIKSYHKNLKGKIKIKCKHRPIGNEIKDMSDAATNIVRRLEMYEGKEDMATKEHVKKFGATCASTLRLTKPLHGSGRAIIADSWFGSVKTVSQLRKAGLHAAMVVTTAHKMYPVDLLSTHKLKRGEWVSYTSEIDGVKLMATKFHGFEVETVHFNLFHIARRPAKSNEAWSCSQATSCGDVSPQRCIN